MNSPARLTLADIAAQVAADTAFAAQWHRRPLDAGRIALLAAAQLMPKGPERDVLQALVKIMREEDRAVSSDPNAMDPDDFLNVCDTASGEYRERAAHYQSGGYKAGSE